MASSTSKAASLALHFLEDRPDPTKSSQSLISQMEHRISLVSFWDIAPGSRVLEIGCGQGDTTIVLADAVGPTGHVDAIDPGSPDYGRPFTLSQAQSHISSTTLGARITFHFDSTLTYLASYSGPPYTHIIFSHCIYYFSSPSILPALISALTPHLSPSTNANLCIAEWSLHSTSAPSFPHVLTALLLSHLESHRPSPSAGNIRTVLSPSQITSAITSASPLLLRKSATRESNPGLRDALWEVSALLEKRETELAELEANGVGEQERTVLEAAFDAIQAGVEGLEGGVEGIKCMDVWIGVFRWGDD